MEKKQQEVRQYEAVGGGSEQAIGVIGLGNMGIAAVKGLLASGVVDSSCLFVSNRDQESTKRKLLQAGLDEASVSIVENNDAIVRSCDMVILSLKQKQLREELVRWKDLNLLSEETLVVSFVAGITVDTIKKWIGRDKQPVARVMPNTPVQSGRGVLGWYITGETSVDQQDFLARVMDNLGWNIRVKEEEKIDVITAISGSGPAYFYEFAKAMIDYAKLKGMDEQHAREIVTETFIGAAVHLDTTKKEVSLLCEEITSPGGTTAAARKSLANEKEGGLYGAVIRAMTAAHDRATEIGRENSLL